MYQTTSTGIPPEYKITTSTSTYTESVPNDLQVKTKFLIEVLNATNYFVQDQSIEAKTAQQELNTNIFKNLNKLVLEVFPEPSIEEELQREIEEDPIRKEFVEIPKSYDEKQKDARQQFIDFLTEIKAVAEANQELEENSYGYPKVFGWYHKEL